MLNAVKHITQKMRNQCRDRMLPAKVHGNLSHPSIQFIWSLNKKTLATTETSIVNWSSRSQPSTCHRQTSLARKRSHLTHLARITDQLNQLSTHLLWWQLSFHITVIDTHLLDERSHTLRALLLMITKLILAIIVLTKTSIRQRTCSETETWKYSITLQRLHWPTMHHKSQK